MLTGADAIVSVWVKGKSTQSVLSGRMLETTDISTGVSALRAQVGALAVHNGPGEPGLAVNGNVLSRCRIVRSLRWRVPLRRDTFALKVVAVVETIHQSVRLTLERGFRDGTNLSMAGH